MDALVVATTAHPTQTPEQLTEALLWSLRRQLQQQFDDWSIRIWTRLVVIDRTLQTLNIQKITSVQFR